MAPEEFGHRVGRLVGMGCLVLALIGAAGVVAIIWRFAWSIGG